MFFFKLETHLMRQELTGAEMGTFIIAALPKRPNVTKVSGHPVYTAKPKAYRMSRAGKDKMSKRISLFSY